MASLGDIRQIVVDVIRLIEFAQDIRYAAKERQRLLDETNNLLSLVEGLEVIWRKFGPEDQAKLHTILKQIKPRISDLQTHLQRNPKSYKNLLSIVMWPTQKADIKKSLEDVRNYNHDLNSLSSAKIVELVGDGQEEQRIQGFIDDHKPVFSHEIAQTPPALSHTDGTGNEFFKRKEFKDWAASDNALLWVHGLPGSGKTGLVYKIMKRLKEDAENSYGVQVACIFCGHQITGLRDMRDAMDIAMSFWAQLVDPTLIDVEFMKQSQLTLRKGVFCPANTIREQKMKIFEHVVTKASRVTLILDGLDEIPRHHQSEVVGILKDIMRNTQQCRLLVTSRPYESICRLFSDDSHFSLKASKMDLTLYIKDRISRKQNCMLTDHATLVENVIAQLLPKCEGLFLLAKLFMDQILRATSPANCLEIIDKLPKSVHEAYDQGLDRLAEEFPDVEEGDVPCTAIQALFWVVYAKGPMTEVQLKQALAIKFGAQDHDHTREVFKGFALTSICADYLVVNHEDRTLQVAHKTITDHLLEPKTRNNIFPRIEEHIPTTLLQFLQFDCMKKGGKEISRDEFIDRYPLSPYALQFWGEGLAKFLGPPQPETLENPLWKMTETTLKESVYGWNDHVNEQATEALASRLGSDPDKEGWPSKEWFAPGTINGLHWVVFFDLPMFVPILAEHDRERLDRDPIPTTPLGLAAICERESSLMDILITNGAKANLSQDTDHIVRPPIFDAVFAGNKKIISKLLEIGVDISSRRGARDESPLDMAFWIDREEIAGMLATHISEKLSISAQELQFLVRGGFFKPLEDSIGRGLDVNHACENGKMALDYAKEMGNQEIMDLLIRSGAGSKLTWPAVPTNLCPYPLNFPQADAMSPIASGEKHWGEESFAEVQYSVLEHHEPDSLLLLEVPVRGDIKHQVRSIVFETVSADQGWSSHYEGPPIYMGSLRSRICIRLKQKDEMSQDFLLQNNVHGDSKFRLHTNIWNLSELEVSSPAKAALLQNIRKSSILQVWARAGGGAFWACKVSYVRVRMFKTEV